MPQPYELKNLYAQGKYEQVAEFWKDPEEVRQFNQWDFNNCMNALYKLQRYEDCMEVYRQCRQRYPEFDGLNNKMGWALYHTGIKSYNFEKGSAEQFRQLVDTVFRISDTSMYSPRWLVAKCMLKAIDKGHMGEEKDWALAGHYLDLIDPAALGSEEGTVRDEEGKIKRTASNKESWYSDRTKVLLNLKEYDACIACADEALKVLDRFHSNNDSWFRYRKAKCLDLLGDKDEAKKIVKEIVDSGFKHWCVYEMMFDLEREAGNADEAMRYAGMCALADGSHGMRVSFYPKVAESLEQEGKTEEAMLHRRLVVLLREENSWKAKNAQASWQFSDRIAAMDKETVLMRLKPLWRELRERNKVFLTGRIEHILPEGRSGFIKPDAGKTAGAGSYYFNASDIIGKRQFDIGTRVRFTLVNKLDKKKGVMKPNAVEISVL